MLSEVLKEYVISGPDGEIEIKKIFQIYRDGVLIATQNQLESLAPGDDVSSKSERVKAIAAVVHTPEVVKAHKDRIAEQASKRP